MSFNINGRICLLYSIFWGILTWAMLGFFVVNSTVSLMAVNRWSERVYGVEAEGELDQLMDCRFPDERMERIFANMEFCEGLESGKSCPSIRIQ